MSSGVEADLGGDVRDGPQLGRLRDGDVGRHGGHGGGCHGDSEARCDDRPKTRAAFSARHGDQLLDRHSAHRRDPLRDLADEGRLVALAPVRHRRQVGTVGLQEQPVQGRLQDGLVEAPVLEGDHPAERHIVAEDQPRPQEPEAAAERVQNRHDPRVRAEDGGDVVVGLAGVDHDRLAGLGRQGELGLEGGVLAVARASGRSGSRGPSPRPRPPGDPAGADAASPLVSSLQCRGVVGVDAGRGGEPGLGPGQREGAIGRLRRLADHDDHALDPRRPRPLQHLGAIGVVGGRGEMAVGVDEHGRRAQGDDSAGRVSRRAQRGGSPAYSCDSATLRLCALPPYRLRLPSARPPGPPASACAHVAPGQRRRASASRSPSAPARRCRSTRRCR